VTSAGGKQFGRSRPELDEPAGRAALGRGHTAVDEGLTHIETPIQQLHVAPVQSEQFAAAHRGAERGERDRARKCPPIRICVGRPGLNLSLASSSL